MKITVLCENYVKGRDLLAQHGLSLYIEANGKKILFDMGQSDVFIKNAEILDVHLEEIDFSILSHGHYDHGGGAVAFLNNFEKIPLYINENAFGNFYSKKGYIGLDKSISENENVILTDGVTGICDGITLVSASLIENKKINSDGLMMETEKGKIPDDFMHEQYLLIKENDKKILVSGCSHKGILNIIDYFKPDVFVGGLHLVSLEAGSSDLLSVAEKLAHTNVKYYVCHCTGIDQYGVLKSVLKDNAEYIYCGSKINI